MISFAEAPLHSFITKPKSIFFSFFSENVLNPIKIWKDRSFLCFVRLTVQRRIAKGLPVWSGDRSWVWHRLRWFIGSFQLGLINDLTKFSPENTGWVVEVRHLSVVWFVRWFVFNLFRYSMKSYLNVRLAWTDDHYSQIISSTRFCNITSQASPLYPLQH